jgi:hypothetical protein
MTLLLLQALVDELPDLDVAKLVSSSALRNPYTGEAIESDSRAATIGFACLHTVHHPPEPVDQCAVFLGRPAP